MEKILICKHCGNMMLALHDAGVPVVCCGEPMTELAPNVVDASHEKHVPVVTVTENAVRVEVGSAPHPMIEEHHIEWILLETEKGAQLRRLSPGDAPKATFLLESDRPRAAYAYCNLHGLWKSEIPV